MLESDMALEASIMSDNKEDITKNHSAYLIIFNDEEFNEFQNEIIKKIKKSSYEFDNENETIEEIKEENETIKKIKEENKKYKYKFENNLCVINIKKEDIPNWTINRFVNDKYDKKNGNLPELRTL